MKPSLESVYLSSSNSAAKMGLGEFGKNPFNKTAAARIERLSFLLVKKGDVSVGGGGGTLVVCL